MKYLRKSWVSYITLVAGALLLVTGLSLLEGVGELRDRTEQTIAIVEADAINFTTRAGIDYALPLEGNNCKRAEPPPRRGCIETYQVGDEVLVWYDSADPSHTWEGSTPGGGIATSALYAGIVLLVFAFVSLYMALIHPRIKAASVRVNEIMHRSPHDPG